MINENIDLFFAQLDEKQTVEIIDIYEKGDKAKLEAFLSEIHSDVPFEELKDALEMLVAMRDDFSNFS